MIKRLAIFAVIAIAAITGIGSNVEAAPPGQPTDWQRFYHYPYVYYPHSFEQPQTYDNLYHRYSPSMRIPVYNRDWYSFYPTKKAWHKGNHFRLDVF